MFGSVTVALAESSVSAVVSGSESECSSRWDVQSAVGAGLEIGDARAEEVAVAVKLGEPEEVKVKFERSRWVMIPGRRELGAMVAKMGRRSLVTLTRSECFCASFRVRLGSAAVLAKRLDLCSEDERQLIFVQRLFV